MNKLRLVLVPLVWTVHLLRLTGQNDSFINDSLIIAKAARCVAKGNMDSAAIYHNILLEKYKKEDQPFKALHSYVKVFDPWIKMNKPLELLDTLDAAFEKWWMPPRNKEEMALYARFLMSKGYIYQDVLKDINIAKEYYEQTFHIFKDDLDGQNGIIAKFIYQRLGNIYTRLGDYERAKMMLQEGASYGQANKIEKLKSCNSDLAQVFISQNKLDSAEVLLKTHPADPQGDPRLRINYLNNYSLIWLRRKNSLKALEVLEEVPGLLDKIAAKYDTPTTFRWKAEYYSQRAKVLLEKSEEDSAMAFFQMSLEAWQKSLIGEANSREMAKTNLAIGKLKLNKNQPKEAVAHCQLALHCVLPDFEPLGDENPNPSLFTAENTIIEALELKASCLEKMGRTMDALACYTLLPKVETKLRETYQYENSALLLLSERRFRLEKAIALARKLYDETSNPDFAQTAFYLTELTRGEMLAQSLAAAAAATALPPALRMEEQELRSRMAWHEQELAIARKQKSSAIGDLEAALFQDKQRYAALLDKLENSYPNYLNMKQDLDWATVEDVKGMLREGQALASFFIENDSLLHVFFFQPGGQLTWRSEVLPSKFYLDAETLTGLMGKKNMTRSDMPIIAGKAYDLYRLLLQPELSNKMTSITSLLIVPDLGPLSFLPFETLLEQPSQPGQPYGEMAFLLKTMAISCLTSVTLAKLFRERFGKDRAEDGFAGFAPRYEGGVPIPDWVPENKLYRDTLYDLPGAREEVRQIHELMGGDIYSDELARKDAFLKNAHRYKTLHLAMHAVVDQGSPTLGRLYFTKKAEDDQMEYTLYAKELGNLSLKADLAVLSACNTGKGKVRVGEGVFSLARSFNLAGVPNVVMSLWSLPDDATPEIMVAFYKNMRTTPHKDEALRLAKLSYLQAHSTQSNLQHPFYWAGLVLSGLGE